LKLITTLALSLQASLLLLLLLLLLQVSTEPIAVHPTETV
jgi:hypothetical protein